MENKRVQALLAQLEQVRIDLGAEFTYLEGICEAQLKEIKQLRFEAMESNKQPDMFECVSLGALLQPYDPTVHFDPAPGEVLPESHELRCEDMHDYMIDYEQPDPVMAELILEGTIDGKKLPFDIVAADIGTGKPVQDWLEHFCSMGRTLAFSDAEGGDYFDVLLWRYVAIVDVHFGERA